MSEQKSKSVRCILVGDGNVGKSTLVVRYLTGELFNEYIPTIFENYQATISVDGNNYELQIIDTGGQEDYNNLRPLCYKPTPDVFLICFSVGSADSFENVSTRWFPEIRHTCPTVPFLLIATKFDLRTDSEAIKYMSQRTHNSSPVAEIDGKKLAQKIKAANYMECSSTTKENVAEVFEEVIRTAVNNENYDTLLQKHKETGCLDCTII